MRIPFVGRRFCRDNRAMGRVPTRMWFMRGGGIGPPAGASIAPLSRWVRVVPIPTCLEHADAADMTDPSQAEWTRGPVAPADEAPTASESPAGEPAVARAREWVMDARASGRRRQGSACRDARRPRLLVVHSRWRPSNTGFAVPTGRNCETVRAPASASALRG